MTIDWSALVVVAVVACWSVLVVLIVAADRSPSASVAVKVMKHICLGEYSSRPAEATRASCACCDKGWVLTTQNKAVSFPSIVAGNESRWRWVILS